MKQLMQLKVKGEFHEVNVEPWETPLYDIWDDIELTAHLNARTLDEGSYLLRTHEAERAKVISGGVDILRMMKQKYTPELPDVLVNIKTIPDLAYIKEDNETLKIGALSCLSDIETSELIRANYSILAEAASVVGSPQIRNMVTIAGTICQDVGCWYYRASKNYFPCLRKGDMNCPAKEGDNRWMFGIFGTPKGCECYATCQSDISIALSALSASVKTTQRTIPIDQFYTPIYPGSVLRPDEIIIEIQVPTLSTGTKAKYSKFSIRKSWDHPLISVACLASDKQAKVVIGGVFITPYSVNEAEDIIKGEKIDEDLAEKVGEIIVRSVTPMSMNAWKIQVTRTLVKRTILALT
jgi:xanthine dehydrogenase YagS FAD-binding subunit